MDDSASPPTTRDLRAHLDAGAFDAIRKALERYRRGASDERQAALRALTAVAEDDPERLGPLVDALEPFLVDDDRAVRLLSAKLLVTLADVAPTDVLAVVPALAERLADESEFYYVRARSAEALGYVAREAPEAVATPDVVADLCVGLAFDEPAVREKLATALECIALGDPSRLRHQTETLAAHLDDDAELVRYHLSTAATVVACVHPEAVCSHRDALVERLGDGSPYVRGRAAEALGVLTRADGVSAPAPPALETVRDDEAAFAATRARFALGDADAGEAVGTVAGVRETTDDAVADITAPDAACPNCGVDLPDPGPPTCPNCGVPRGPPGPP
ncbi:HEAT repeat domain-containing protein (plasmid) [Halarchaeum sp. CBA1220]|uniref:HEAT repeat domain-containing protein n=1 Tax=Halarchaeum sp. CBA1220 TaxID=1853682 RepID=UPI000F3A8538|nr:HEAT repeat domain-containing protein [Halarchaeum sp. CBA1220]QLC35323.1 HEAT repeat domain-containing protein [Halarchaeum sp. CBA1220]